MHVPARVPRARLAALVAAIVAVSAVSSTAAGAAPQPQPGPECLLGTWVVDAADDGARVLEALAADVSDVTVTTGEGDATLTFTKDTITFAYDGSAITEEYTFDGHRYEYRFVMNGTASARYQATSDAITTQTPAGDVYAVDHLTVDGVRVEDPSTAAYLPRVPWGLQVFEGAWRYTCSADQLAIHWFMDDGFGDLSQVFTRRSPAPSPTGGTPSENGATPSAPQGTTPSGETTTGTAAPRAQAARPAVASPRFTG